jgi:hypothetical protein
VLLDVCGIRDDETNLRVTLAVVALNGRARPREPGIRDAFWAECRRQADGDDARLAALHEDPARFAALLADRIRLKADRYRSAMPPGSMLTPKALRDWWHDIENRDAGRLTADDLERLAGGS